MKYTLIFSKSTNVPWYAKLLRYTHAALIQHQENGIDVGIDAKKGKIIIDAQKNLGPVSSGLDILVFHRNIPEGLDLRAPCFSTCVSVVKKILAIQDWRIITPYQLQQYVLNKMWTIPEEK